jgi:hypothetical protein
VEQGPSSDNGPRIEFNIVICIYVYLISPFLVFQVTLPMVVRCWAGNVIPSDRPIPSAILPPVQLGQ